MKKMTSTSLLSVLFFIAFTVMVCNGNPVGAINTQMTTGWIGIRQYKGRIVDGVTEKPLAGVSVLVWWGIHVPTIAGPKWVLLNSTLVTTDDKGTYRIPANVHLAPTDVNFLFYQPGYLVITGKGSYRDSSLIVNTEKTIDLKRIPPFFDHSIQMDTINNSLYSSYNGRKAGAFRLLKKNIRRRADWETRRFYLSSPEKNRYRAKHEPFSSDLEKQLRDRSAETRRLAAKQFGYCRDQRAVKLLIEMLNDKDFLVRYEAAFSLGEMNSAEAILPLLQIVDSEREGPHTVLQQEALKAINKIIVPNTISFIADIKEREPVTDNITKITGGLDNNTLNGFKPDLLPVLKKQFNNEYLKDIIALLFEHLDAADTLKLLEDAITHTHPRVRRYALASYMRIALAAQRLISPSERKIEDDITYTGKAFAYLAQSLADPDTSVRAGSVGLLGRWGKATAIAPLISMLDDKESVVRKAALEGLKAFADPRILKAVVANFDADKDAEVTFLSVAEKTSKKFKYITAQKNRRYTSDANPFPDLEFESFTWEGNRYQRRMNHPDAIGGLLDSFNSLGKTGKLTVLDLLCRFEDDRIARAMNEVALDQDEELQDKIQKVVTCSDDGHSMHVSALPVAHSGTKMHLSKKRNLAGGVGKARIQAISKNGHGKGIGSGFHETINIDIFRDFYELNNLSQYYKDTIISHENTLHRETAAKHIHSKDPGKQGEAIKYLIDHADRQSIDFLIELLSSPHEHIQTALKTVFEDLVDHPVHKFYLYDKLMPLAEGGNVIAQYIIARIQIVTREYGTNINNDTKTAMIWLAKAADKNYVPAILELGSLYERRFGDKEVFLLLMEWYQNAASLGSVRAEYKIGRLYVIGRGDEQDLQKGFSWYQKASEHGDKDAQRSLGLWYYTGRGIPTDYPKALKWFKQASLQGDVDSPYMIGEMYRRGLGVEQDNNEALVWYQRADKVGHVLAIKAINNLLVTEKNR